MLHAKAFKFLVLMLVMISNSTLASWEELTPAKGKSARQGDSILTETPKKNSKKVRFDLPELSASREGTKNILQTDEMRFYWLILTELEQFCELGNLSGQDKINALELLHPLKDLYNRRSWTWDNAAILTPVYNWMVNQELHLLFKAPLRLQILVDLSLMYYSHSKYLGRYLHAPTSILLNGVAQAFKTSGLWNQLAYQPQPISMMEDFALYLLVELNRNNIFTIDAERFIRYICAQDSPLYKQLYWFSRCDIFKQGFSGTFSELITETKDFIPIMDPEDRYQSLCLGHILNRTIGEHELMFWEKTALRLDKYCEGTDLEDFPLDEKDKIKALRLFAALNESSLLFLDSEIALRSTASIDLQNITNRPDNCLIDIEYIKRKLRSVLTIFTYERQIDQLTEFLVVYNKYKHTREKNLSSTSGTTTDL